MAVDAAQFQWYKFCNYLTESETQTSGLSLITQLQGIQQSLKGSNLEKLITASPEKSRELLGGLNDVLAECRIFTHCYNKPFHNKNPWRFNPLTKSLFLRKRMQKLRKIRAEIESLQQGGLIMEPNPARSLLLAPADVTATVVIFDEMVAEAENVLLGEKGEDSRRRFTAYGITGLAGTGKTALAREVFSRQEIFREFVVRIWLSLSDNSVGEEIGINITKHLLDQLGYDADEELRGTSDADHDILDLLTELEKRLSESGKYLIVFDHVWQESEWYERLSSCLGVRGAAIVTGEREDLVKRIVGQRSFITCLDHEDKEGGMFMANMASKIENVLLGRGGENFIAYGIIGMPGAGKTALARQVFNSASVRQEFPVRIWVCLSGIERDHDTVKCMLEQLHFDADHEMRGTDANDMVVLLAALKKMLRKQKYLIVLDGVWSENEWYQDLQGLTHHHHPNRLSHGLPKATDGFEGGAVIVTGRVEGLVTRVVGDHSRVTSIDHDSEAVKGKCWEIFEHVLKKQGHGAPLSENMKRDIQYKIQGLPLAANTLARIIPAQIRDRDMSTIRSQT